MWACCSDGRHPSTQRGLTCCAMHVIAARRCPDLLEARVRPCQGLHWAECNTRTLQPAQHFLDQEQTGRGGERKDCGSVLGRLLMLSMHAWSWTQVPYAESRQSTSNSQAQACFGLNGKVIQHFPLLHDAS